MCGGGKAPTQPTVDPAAERQASADAAAQRANATLVNDRRRKRGQAGLLSADSESENVMQQKASQSGAIGAGIRLGAGLRFGKNTLQSVGE